MQRTRELTETDAVGADAAEADATTAREARVPPDRASPAVSAKVASLLSGVCRMAPEYTHPVRTMQTLRLPVCLPSHGPCEHQPTAFPPSKRARGFTVPIDPAQAYDQRCRERQGPTRRKLTQRKTEAPDRADDFIIAAGQASDASVTIRHQWASTGKPL